jgi:hypothetical protein
MTEKQLFKLVREIYPAIIAEELVKVQPMKDVDWQAIGEALERLRAYRRSLGSNCCDDPIQI